MNDKSNPSEITVEDISHEIDMMIEQMHESIARIRQKQERLNKENESMLTFAQGTEKYVVGIIDIVNSTSICSKLSDEKASDYYQIFLNSMNDVIKKFGGVVSKNIGILSCTIFQLILPEKDKCWKNVLTAVWH